MRGVPIVTRPESAGMRRTGKYRFAVRGPSPAGITGIVRQMPLHKKMTGPGFHGRGRSDRAIMVKKWAGACTPSRSLGKKIPDWEKTFPSKEEPLFRTAGMGVPRNGKMFL